MKKISEKMIAESKENFKIEMLMNSIENNASVIISIYEEKLKATKEEVKTLKAYPIQILQLREEYGYFDTGSVIINSLQFGPSGKPRNALWTSSYLLNTDPKKEVDNDHRLEPITDWEDFAKEEQIESYNGNLYEVMPVSDALIMNIDHDMMNIIKLDGTIIVPFSELITDNLLFIDHQDKFVMDFHYLRRKYKVDIVHATYDAVHVGSGIEYYGQGIYKYMRFLDTTVTNWDVESSFWLNPDAINEVKYIGKA
jgi:hypothetical protein